MFVYGPGYEYQEEFIATIDATAAPNPKYSTVAAGLDASLSHFLATNITQTRIDQDISIRAAMLLLTSLAPDVIDSPSSKYIER